MERKGPKRRWFIHIRDDENITSSLFIQKLIFVCMYIVCIYACMYVRMYVCMHDVCTYVHACATVSPDVCPNVCVQRLEVESGCLSLLLSTVVR